MPPPGSFHRRKGSCPSRPVVASAAGEPIGYDIHTFSLYDKTSVGPILNLYSKK